MMERHVLRDQLQQLIGDHKVTAALFYTFNFDPAFFENYVMPLLLPGKDFNDKAIHNHILWRKCLKEKLVPPITVYCDHYAKDNTAAPMLGYDIRCIRLPGRAGRLVNFHPKECWLLLDNQELIHVNSSANLTPSGWCENLECCAVTKLRKNSHPKTVAVNIRQQVLQQVSNLAQETRLSLAEQHIYNFLRYTDDTSAYFSSLNQSFSEKLNALSYTYGSDVIEVVSPYMYGEGLLIDLLFERGFKQINCLIPSLKTNEVLLSKETFLSMRDKGVTWCQWSDKKVNQEVRNLHAKLYRLHGPRQMVTVTGSVNFTGPAWGKCTALANNAANVESAVIHVEAPAGRLLSPVTELNIDQLTFLAKEDMGTTETTGEAGRAAPLLYFTLNWKTRSLSFTGKIVKAQRVAFRHILAMQELTAGRKSFALPDQDFRALSQNALIELTDLAVPDQVYSYYPRQVEIESRPLNFKLSPDAILGFWLEEDASVQEEIAALIAEQITGEDGVVDGDYYQHPSLLNEMARHFTGLIALEKKLFQPGRQSPQEQFQNLRYYLLSENLDTVPFYLKGIADLAEQKKITNSFQWMLLQIARIRIYEKALGWPFKSAAGGSWQSFRKGVLEHLALIVSQAALCGAAVKVLPAKAEWFVGQLKRDHDG